MALSKLFLLPAPICADSLYNQSIDYLQILDSIEVLVVENLRTARRALRKYGYKKDFDSEVEMIELDKHSEYEASHDVKLALRNKKIIGLMSEAGVPCVADPGNKIVFEAHKENYEIIPLTGSSSILKTLMASGLNGQNFAFQGYLPFDSSDKKKFWKKIEERINHENQTQLFMDAPYRNDKLIAEILKIIDSNLYLTIAVEIDNKDAFITTKKIYDWKKIDIPSFHKRPMMCVLGKV